MLISGIPAWAAPQSTGHPQALPATPAPAASDSRVVALAGSKEASLGQSGDGSAQDDGTASRKDQKAAPPTIMQIKIATMLQEQAEARADETPA